MKTLEFGYNNFFEGYTLFFSEDFNDKNVKQKLLLSDDASLIIRNDDLKIYIHNTASGMYISSDSQYSYALNETEKKVIVKF